MLSDAAAPLPGDVMRFLVRGDGFRNEVRQRIADQPDGPVYLLCHSLGGIVCVDLLVRVVVPEVAGLITVGSQAPFMYEIGALPSLMHPDPLPKHFPAWLNIYDRRDVLSYIGSDPEVFGASVEDVEVDNGQPFPESHSAYWTNPAVWGAISSFLR